MEKYDGAPKLRTLRKTFRPPPSRPKPDLLLLAKLSASPEAAVATDKASDRPRIPNQSARCTAGLAGTPPELLAKLPREQSRAYATADSSHWKPRRQSCKDGRVRSAIRRLPNPAPFLANTGSGRSLAHRDHASVSKLPMQKGRVQREDLIDTQAIRR